MKKVVSAMLALVMVFALGAVAFAATPQDVTFNIPVYYIYPEANAGTVKPAETFTIAISDCTNHNENAPTFKAASVALAFTESDKAEDVQFAEFTVDGSSLTKPGTYTYNVTETGAHDYAGLEYDKTVAVLTVFVSYDENDQISAEIGVKYDGEKINGGKKNEDTQKYEKTEDTSEAEETFTNTYKAAVIDPNPEGTKNNGLNVQKLVKGNMGDRNKEFTVTVSFESAKVLASAIKYNDGTAKTLTLTKAQGATNYTGSVELKLKHNSTVAFDNVPYGVTYTVTEADYSADGYETTYTLDGAAVDSISAKTVAAPSIAAKVINTNGTDKPETGVILDVLPYALILLVVAAAVAVVVLKKRKAEEY